jgi:hypothetical protein
MGTLLTYIVQALEEWVLTVTTHLDDGTDGWKASFRPDVLYYM